MLARRANLFLCFLAVIGSALGRSKEFDVLIFTQRWPQTVCILWKESSDWHTCYLPPDPSSWTIHGLWPSQYHEIGPGFCNRNLPFNRAALAPLEAELKKKWVDIEYGTESYSLWRHEWLKHGTCAAVLPELSTEEKYFAKGLALLEQYGMESVLSQSNILPGGDYAVSDVLAAIENALGARGMVACRRDKMTGIDYISEIRICFDKSLQLINCDGIFEFPTNCDTVGTVNYPMSASNYYHTVQV